MMSTPEFFGVFLGLAVAMAAMFAMRVAYEAAIHERFTRTKFYLKFASGLSLASWVVMTAVIFKYNKDYSVLRAAKMFQAEPETQIVGQGIVSPKMYSVELHSGSVIQWGHGDGLRNGRRGSRDSDRFGVSSGSRDGGRYRSLQLPYSGIADGGDGSSGMSRAESENDFRL